MNRHANSCHSSFYVGVDQLAGLVARAGHQMPIAGEGLLDGCVPHELLDRLGVDPGVDQE
jgi:hypothetical protein